MYKSTEVSYGILVFSLFHDVPNCSFLILVEKFLLVKGDYITSSNVTKMFHAYYDWK